MYFLIVFVVGLAIFVMGFMLFAIFSVFEEFENELKRKAKREAKRGVKVLERYLFLKAEAEEKAVSPELIDAAIQRFQRMYGCYRTVEDEFLALDGSWNEPTHTPEHEQN